MLNLIELVNILDSYKAQKLQTLENPYNSDTYYSKFYQGIKSGNIKTDEEAIAFLYDDIEVSNQKYKRLKHRFKNKLLNSIFLIDTNQPNYTDGQKAFYSCYKDLAKINILIGKGAKKTALELGQKTLRIALKYELTEVVVNIISFLRLHHTNFYGNEKKFNEFNELYYQQSYLLEAESKAEELYCQLIIHLIGSKDYNKEYAQKSKEYAQALGSYKDKVNTHKFIFFSYYIEMIEYELGNDYKKVIEICAEAYNKLASKNIQLKVKIFPFVFKAFYGNLKLCKYLAAQKLIEPCLASLDFGARNWFKFSQMHFIFLLRTDQFAKAKKLLEEVINNRNYAFQDNDTLEIWKIYEAYIHLMTEDSNFEKLTKTNFKIGKFLNEVPVFSKDKRGLNVSIIIVQIMLLLKQEKYNTIIDKMAGLERYSSRYLGMFNTYRCNCFIKMLLQLGKRSFHPIAVQRHTEKYMKKLQEVPLEKSEAVLEMEIIPYDTLWKMILKLLAKQQKLEVYN